MLNLSRILYFGHVEQMLVLSHSEHQGCSIPTDLVGPSACCSAGPERTEPPAAPPPAAPPDSESGNLCTPWPRLQSLEGNIEEGRCEMGAAG